MTDTTTLAPTDAEIDHLLATHWPAVFAVTEAVIQWRLRHAVREAIAKWGAPAPASGEPAAQGDAQPAPVEKPKNPHWDYLKRYWEDGFNRVMLGACTGDAPIKAWNDGKTARITFDAAMAAKKETS